MKCPFRKTTAYECLVNRVDENYFKITVRVHCTTTQAHFVTEDFADCLAEHCAGYVDGKCKMVGGKE